MILNVAPKWDVATEYSYRWNRRLMEELGEPALELLEGDATRERVEEVLRERRDVDVLIFFGHGTEDGLVEQGGAGYVIDGKNVHLLRGREVYTLACLWGKKGGVEAYRKGAKAIWAYTDTFVFVTTDEEVFGRLANMGLILRRKEHLSWDECLKRVREAYDEEIEKRREGGNPWTVIALVHNRDALVCWWDLNPPPAECRFRELVVRLLGRAGQKLSRDTVLAWMMFFVSFGVALHDYCHALWEVGGYPEILSPQGGYIGFLGMLLAFLYLMKEHVKWLGR